MDLEPIDIDDVKELYKMYQEGSQEAFFRNFPRNINKEQLLAILKLSGDVLRVVSNKQVVGWLIAGMHPLTRMASIGLMIKPQAQHAGHAAAAVKVAAKHFFDKMDANKLVCVCSRDDKRTMQLLEKAKFYSEARLRDNTFYGNALHDEIRWALPRDRYYKLYGKE